jgi:hypothetical protein
MSNRKLLPLLLLLAACHATPPIATPAASTPPALVTGTFTDDYGSRHVVSDTLWQHGTRNRYRIVRWNVAEQYLIAQNDSSNSAEKGRWSRIDWMPLTGMPPYTWGFCLTAWDAPTRATAEATPAPNRAAPKTGCGGYPFSRMTRLTAAHVNARP